MRRVMVVLAVTMFLVGCGTDDDPSNPAVDATNDAGGDATAMVDLTEADTSAETDATTEPDTDATTEPDTVATDVQDEEVAAPTFGIATTPALEEWTPDYTAITDCACSADLPDCAAIYKGRVIAVNGNLATLEFEKTPSGAPSVAVSYWVVVDDATEPSCVNRDAFISRVEGTWDGGVLQVPIWLDEAAFDAALVGEQKKLFVITGGGANPTTPFWFQRQAVVFEKVAL